MSFFSRLAGTIEAIFHIGGPTGPQLKNNGGTAIDARNGADGAYVPIRVADPIGVHDAVSLEFFDNNAILQGGNTFSPTTALLAGQNDANLSASFAVPATGTPYTQLLLSGNNGVGPIALLDVLGGQPTPGAVNVATGPGAKTFFIGNNDPATIGTIEAFGGMAISSGPGSLTLGSQTQDHTTLLGGHIVASPVTIRSGTTGINTIAPLFALNPFPAGAATQTQALEFWNLANTHYVAFQAPTIIGANVNWILPAADGTTGQVLTTNGAQQLMWSNPGVPAGGLQSILIPIALASVSSLTQLPVGAIVSRCTVYIGVAYTTGTIEVGQAGFPDQFQAAGDNNPTALGGPHSYDAPQTTGLAVSPGVVLVTITGATGAGAGGFVYIEYSIPQP